MEAVMSDDLIARMERLMVERAGLRAEVARLREAVRYELDIAETCIKGCFLVCETCGHENDTSDMDVMIFIRSARAALTAPGRPTGRF
jgi:hypothetical protein